jgi:putative intracellular protease/amidase
MTEDTRERRALVAVTNHDHILGTSKPTGLWLGELVHFYDVLDAAGFNIDLVSPKGGKVPLDPASTGGLLLGKASRARLSDARFLERLENSLAPEQVRAQDYDCIFFAGGHGTMWDFPGADALQRIAGSVYEAGGVVAAVCHGVAGLLNVRLSDESNLIDGKRLTGFSNTEEKLSRLADKVPFSLEDELKRAGAQYTKAWLPLARHVVVDGRVVTGQNPSSTKAVAERTLDILRDIS